MGFDSKRQVSAGPGQRCGQPKPMDFGGFEAGCIAVGARALPTTAGGRRSSSADARKGSKGKGMTKKDVALPMDYVICDVLLLFKRKSISFSFCLKGDKGEVQRLPVKTQCSAHFGIGCELGNRKKWDERHAAFTYENTMFFAVWNGLRIRNRKKWDERRMQHLPLKTQCFLQFGIGCKVGNRRNGTGSTKVALTCENTTFPAAWNKLGIRE